jgi:hypothetical protein
MPGKTRLPFHSGLMSWGIPNAQAIISGLPGNEEIIANKGLSENRKTEHLGTKLVRFPARLIVHYALRCLHRGTA